MEIREPTFSMVSKHKEGEQIRGKLSTISWKNKEEKLIFQPFHANNPAFLLLPREDAINGAILLWSCFKKIGLTIHTRDKLKNEKSKTEYIFIPNPGYSPTKEDHADLFINQNRFISSCTKFQYLGPKIIPTLKCDTDISNRTLTSQFLHHTLNKQVFRCKDVNIDIWRRIYVAIIVNILLWGCKSWPLASINQ